MRLFLAVFPPRAIQEAAHAVANTLHRPGDAVSWVKAENLHYTLRFIGEMGEGGAQRIAEAAHEVAAMHQAFDAELGGLGAFPSSRRARVIWIGMRRGAEAMQALALELEEALRRRKFSHAEKSFSAHLTIGRVRLRRDRGPAPRSSGGDWGERFAQAGFAGGVAPAFRVGHVRLMESRLAPGGAVYSVRDEAALMEAPSARR